MKRLPGAGESFIMAPGAVGRVFHRDLFGAGFWVEKVRLRNLLEEKQVIRQAQIV